METKSGRTGATIDHLQGDGCTAGLPGGQGAKRPQPPNVGHAGQSGRHVSIATNASRRSHGSSNDPPDHSPRASGSLIRNTARCIPQAKNWWRSYAPWRRQTSNGGRHEAPAARSPPAATGMSGSTGASAVTLLVYDKTAGASRVRRQLGREIASLRRCRPRQAAHPRSPDPEIGRDRRRAASLRADEGRHPFGMGMEL